MSSTKNLPFRIEKPGLSSPGFFCYLLIMKHFLILTLVFAGLSSCAPVEGCTNPLATNFDPEADSDDGTCLIQGCTDSAANNYNPEANSDDAFACLYTHTCTCVIDGEEEVVECIDCNLTEVSNFESSCQVSDDIAQTFGGSCTFE